MADKARERAAVFSDAISFLEKIIEDNAISYAQDRKCKGWTFNYYTRNARASLELLANYWPQQVPAYEGSQRNPTERWDYCQTLLDEAVTCFEAAAGDKQASADDARRSREKRSAAKERRRVSRAVTLASRKASK